MQQMIYKVDFSQATRHLALVSLWIPVRGEQQITLVFPVWTPGSYMLREYTRNIESITPHAHADKEMPSTHVIDTTRQGKNRWHLSAPENCQWVRVDYQVYCRENSVRTNWVERDYGFLTGA